MTTLHFTTSAAVKNRLYAYAEEHKISVNDAMDKLINLGLVEFESQGIYAQLFNKAELRDALASYYD